MNEDDLKTTIVAFVGEVWKRGEPALLSQVGQLNDGEVAEASKVISGRLSTYISTQLRDDVILIRHSSIIPLIGVIPRNSETESLKEFDHMLEKKKSELSDRSGRPRLNPSFWAAFRKLLDPDQRRYLAVADRINFVNKPSDEAAPAGMLEIQREYIAQNDLETDREIFEKIEKWCINNELTLSKFERKVEELPQLKSSASNRTSRSVLDRILEILNEDDLRRIQITMDVVKKLSK